jgi:hypothetical protein
MLLPDPFVVAMFSNCIALYFTLKFFLAAPHSMWDLVLRPGMKLMVPALEAWSFNHWNAKEFPALPFG